MNDFGVLTESIAVCSFGYADLYLLGNGIGSAHGATPTSCLRLCVERGCTAFTWIARRGGMCLLRSGGSMTVRIEGARSGAVLRKDYGECGKISFHWSGTDFAGHDHASAPSANFRSFQCASRSDCRSYMWSDRSNGTCWFKGEAREVRHAPGKHSGLATFFTAVVV